MSSQPSAQRPPLTSETDATDFLAFYWLKAELIAFCRENGLSATGSKQALTDRIGRYLTTGIIEKPVRKKRTKTTMPTTFTRESVIGEGWRCSQELRHFFEAEIGRKFHFNAFMRNYIKEAGVGQTLQTAIDGWLESKQQPAGSQPISGQFEYNQHTRDYYKQHPNATRAEVIAAWKAKRAQRKEL